MKRNKPKLNQKMILAGVAVVILLYHISFAVMANLFTDLTISSGFGPPVKNIPYLYMSRSSNKANRVGKILYYPIIRTGEWVGWWRYLDDTSDFRM